MQIYDSEKPLDEKTLAEAEAKLGLKLPHSYRAFLLRSNGGSPDPDVWDDESRDLSVYVQYFYPISGNKPNLIAVNQVLPAKLEDGLLVICLEGGGDKIVLDSRDGSIFLWDTNEDYDQPIRAENLPRLADSIGDFLANLT